MRSRHEWFESRPLRGWRALKTQLSQTIADQIASVTDPFPISQMIEQHQIPARPFTRGRETFGSEHIRVQHLP